MALTHAEPRLAPLREVWNREVHSTFQVWGVQPRDRRRSHSHPGYTPHHLRVSHGGGPEEPEVRSRSGSEHRPASKGAAARASGASDGSTSAPGSRLASEAPSSPREHAPELWPDTDSEDEEECYEWSPCSRGERGVSPAPAVTQASPPQVLATTPAGDGAAASPPAAPPAPLLPPAAAVPSRDPAGAPTGAAALLGLLGSVGQPLSQSQPRVPPPSWPPVLARGGQPQLTMVSPVAHETSLLPWCLPAAMAASGPPAEAAAMLAAESALASHAAAVEFQWAWHGHPFCAGRAAAGESGIDVSVATM